MIFIFRYEIKYVVQILFRRTKQPTDNYHDDVGTVEYFIEKTNMNFRSVFFPFSFFPPLPFRSPYLYRPLPPRTAFTGTTTQRSPIRSAGGGGRDGPVVRVALPDGGEDTAVQQRAGGRRRDRAGRGVPGVRGRGTGADGARGGRV